MKLNPSPRRHNNIRTISTQLYVLYIGALLLLSCTIQFVSCTSITVTTTPTSLNSPRLKSLSIAQIRVAAIRKAKIVGDNIGNKRARGGGKNAAIWEGLKNGMASALAAASSKTLLAPFDTIKTMQQQANERLSILKTASIICDRPQGIWELYAGLGVAVLGAMPSVALYFGVYSYSKRTLSNYLEHKFGGDTELAENHYKLLKSFNIVASAAIGNTIASFSRVPFEVMKQKLQTGEYSSTLEAITQMFSNGGGLRTFFPMGGISIQMIRDIPYAMITLLTYEYLRDHWVTHDNTNPWKDMVAGAISGGLGGYLTNPMDVVKTRLQIHPELYNGHVWACACATFDEGGARAFLRGSVPRLLHKIPANGCFFVFYELFRRLLHAKPSTKNTKTASLEAQSKQKSQ